MTLLVSLANSRRRYLVPHVTGRESEAQRGELVSSRSHSEEEVELEFDSDVPVCECLTAWLSCLYK